MPFHNLLLDPKIVKAVEEAGYKKPTKIQARAIPEILSGQDIRGSAQTGTGKTAAFLLPLLNQLLTNHPKPGKGPRALIVVPTRELAMQITEQTNKYSKYLQKVKTVCINGGVSYHIQRRKLSKPYEILIATPGRLVDYIQQKNINFSRIEMLIFDEADRMLDMGFQDAVETIIETIPDQRQTLLFSATMNKEIHKLSEHLLKEPVDVIVHGEKEKHKNITQTLHYVDNLDHKNRLLYHILGKRSVGCSIVFTGTKRHADQLVRELKDQGHKALSLHGDMNQSHRTRTIKKLKEGNIDTLVATDVAARGIDVQHITQVINFDLPRNVEDYVHRIGRTGRAGSSGAALSFANFQDKGLVQRIEKFTGQPIDVEVIEGFEPSKKGGKKKSKPFRRRGKPQAAKPFKRKGAKPFRGKFKKGRVGKAKAR